MPRQLIDITGKRFGRWTVLEYAGKTSHCEAKWLCRCDCGKTSVVTTWKLQNGKSVSCGCYQRERAKEGHAKHGLSGCRLYIIWANMKQRCGNPNAFEYSAYGGRGIRVCEEWAADFKAFYNWAIANGYHETLTIDRIDNDKGYSPDNCRWATMEQQYANRRYHPSPAGGQNPTERARR